MKSPTLDQLPGVRDRVINAILKAADPRHAVREAPLPSDLPINRCRLVVLGKASLPMVEAALKRFGNSVVEGFVTCVPQHEAQVQSAVLASGIKFHIFPADHPLPSDRNVIAGQALAEFSISKTRSDATLILLSGGTSAHLTFPASGLSLDDLRATTNALLRSGATIVELNVVRKHLERLKGGRLAGLLCPARTHVLVLSDVLGDPLDAIGSGPTAPDTSTFADALSVICRHDPDRFPTSVIRHLEAGVRGSISETPKPGDPLFDSFSHQIIANNETARFAAHKAVEAEGFTVLHSRSGVTGEAADVALELVERICAQRSPGAVIYAGETTVTVGDSTGLGGRNQELALAAAIALESVPNVGVLTLATDGIDGPTDAAGAFVTSATCALLRERGIDPITALKRHDSHTALDAVDALIRTGPTGSNINDVAVAMRV